MRYFTPELLKEFRSRDDRLAGVASDKWEQEAEAYAAHLRSIYSRLPPQFRILLDSHYLHDARIAFVSEEDGRKFKIILKLDTPTKEGLELQYKLISKPVIIQHDGIGEPCTSLTPIVVWLYDEVDVTTFNSPWWSWVRPGLRPAFLHSILLSNGLEFQIPFRDFSFAPVRVVHAGGVFTAAPASTVAGPAASERTTTG